MRDGLTEPVDAVAPRLLGATLVSQIGGETVAVRLVEVEAYGGEGRDPASHAHRGPTARNAAMFGPPGHAYVYFTYGMHWCLNIVTGPAGTASAVLLRAGTVTDGLATARHRRTRAAGRVPSDRDLARGPARLAEALGVTGAQNELDLCDAASPLRLLPAQATSSAVAAGPRVGVGQAAQRQWRFWLPDEPSVSAYRAGGRARRRTGQERPR